jgi:aspartate-semialdehyde dehydrogenase
MKTGNVYSMSQKIPVSVLAATGSVGQRFVQLLDNHPWFEVSTLTGSDRSVGRLYGEACHWVLPEPMPAWARQIVLAPTLPEAVTAPIAFSALPADLACEIEPRFARDGVVVCSNASALRREPDVPILLPEVNADHVRLVERQRRERGWTGCIVTNPNCTSTGLTVVLKALQNAFGLRRAMLGEMQADELHPAEFLISAHTNRVAVSDGHMVCVSVEMGTPASVEEAGRVLGTYQAPQISSQLPSAPHPVILLRDEPDRPQPRLDRLAGQGMTTVVGRLRADPIFHLKFVVLSHNTIRGAAGGSIYNAELLVNMGIVGAGRSPGKDNV